MNLNELLNSPFNLPENSTIVSTVDMHTGGEPLRIVLGGLPELRGRNVLEFRRYMMENHDVYRRALMFEPRGHNDMYGCFLTPPNDDEADFGVVFMHNEGYSTMCGHAIIALAKLAVSQNWVHLKTPVTPVVIDAPCGRISATVETSDELGGMTSFDGVPSFVVAENKQLTVDGIGAFTYTLAYGGAFYAYVDGPSINLNLTSSNLNQIIEYGKKIKKVVMDEGAPVEHPFEPDLSFLYGVIFTGGQADDVGAHDRNVCVFADGEVDRSPTGSGVSGRMAIFHANGRFPGEQLRFESITGSVFTASAKKQVDFGPYKAVIPEVSGTAWITGKHQFILDPEDPFKNGFLLR